MVLLALFTLFSVEGISSSYRSVQNHASNGHAYKTVLDVDWFSCLQVCVLETYCMSYNFQRSVASEDGGLCELIDSRAVKDECDMESSLIYTDGGIFHQVKIPIKDEYCKQPCYGNLTKEVLKDCKEILDAGGTQSGVYTIKPDDKGEFEVFCDQSTQAGGWVILQNRFNGSVEFYQNWTSYKEGFGSLHGEFWLGLNKIHRLTSRATGTVLRVEMGDFHNNSAYAEYDSFKVLSEQDGFGLDIGNYSGTSGDSLTWHSSMLFSTYDHDNGDCSANSCAVLYHGAWWYADSYRSNLNGRYYNKTKLTMDGIVWLEWNGGNSLRKTKIKIRSRQADIATTLGKN